MGKNETRAPVAGTGCQRTTLVRGTAALLMTGLLLSGCGEDASSVVTPTPIPQVPPPAAQPEEPAPTPEAVLPTLELRGRWLPAARGRLLLATATAHDADADALAVVTAQGVPSASDGSFEIVLRGAGLDRPGRVELREASRAGGPGDRVVVSFLESLAGTHDFGKLGEGGQPPVLVAGTVIRLDGPVESQGEWVEREWVSEAEESSQPLPNVGLRLIARAFGEEIEIARMAADRQGAFRVHGHVDGAFDELRIVPAGEWTHTESEIFEPGAEDVEVEVALTCRLALELTPEHGLDVEDLEFRLRGDPLDYEHAADVDTIPNGGWSRSDGEISVELRDDGSVTFTGLLPGTYHVALRISGSNEVLERVNDVAVAGRETRLPAFLSGRTVARTPVRVDVPDGVDVEEARLWARTVSVGGPFREIDLTAGAAEVENTGKLLEVVAWAPGCRHATVRSEDASIRVALEPIAATPVEIPLPAGVVRERDGVEILLTVRWDEPLDGARLGDPVGWPDEKHAIGDPRDVLTWEIPLPADGPVHLELSEPGVYRVGCRVRAGDASSAFEGGAALRIDGSGTPVKGRKPFAAATVNRRVEKVAEDGLE